MSATLVLCVWGVWRGPTHVRNKLYPGDPQAERVKATFEMETEIRKEIIQVSAGFVAAFAAVLTIWRTTSLERQVAVAQLSSIADRFNNAIDHLGAAHEGGKPNIEVRIGGIVALERIAMDSPEEHPVVLQIVCTYMRHNPLLPTPGSNTIPNKFNLDVEACAACLQHIFPSIDSPPRQWNPFATKATKADIAARINLSYADLPDIVLHNTNFAGANFTEAVLPGAKLSKCNLDRAWFEGTNIEGADLRESTLIGTHLRRAKLKGALLQGLDLSATVDLEHSRNIEDANTDAKTKFPEDWENKRAAAKNAEATPPDTEKTGK